MGRELGVGNHIPLSFRKYLRPEGSRARCHYGRAATLAGYPTVPGWDRAPRLSRCGNDELVCQFVTLSLYLYLNYRKKSLTVR